MVKSLSEAGDGDFDESTARFRHQHRMGRGGVKSYLPVIFDTNPETAQPVDPGKAWRCAESLGPLVVLESAATWSSLEVWPSAS